MLIQIGFSVLVVLDLVAAGVSLGQKSRNWWIFLVLGLLFLLRLVKECSVRATAPMTRLKSGRYRVDAVLRVNNDFVLVAISWHVAYGHYKHRLARLPNPYFCPRVPTEGDEIRVSRAVPEAYYVHPTHPAPPPPSMVRRIG